MRRASFLTLHRRIALAFAPLLLLQALTGALLLFHAPLARLTGPAVTAGPAVPVSELVARAEGIAPGTRLTRLFLPADGGDAALAQLSATDGAVRYAALDPATGHVLRRGSIFAFPMEAVLQLHYRLLDGRTGMAVVLANGIVLILLSGTGLAFWWPGRGRIVKALAVRSRMPGRVRLRQWHRSGGVVLSVLLLFSAGTGVLLSAPDVLEAGGGSASSAVPPRSAAQIDDAVALACAQFPGAALRDIRFPAADRLDVNLFAPERSARAVHVVSVSLSDQAVLKRVPAADNPVLWMKILPLHTGESFGLAGRLLLLLEALVLAALAMTGPVMWWQARKVRR